MKNKNSKIYGVENIGGIYIDKSINIDFHKHNFIKIILSQKEDFFITLKKQYKQAYQATLIQSNVLHKLESSDKNSIMVIFFDAYCFNGMRLKDNKELFKVIDITSFNTLLDEFYNLEKEGKIDNEFLEYLINSIVDTICENSQTIHDIDSRIKKCLKYIDQNGSMPIKNISDYIGLSPSYFAFLFKQETGLTFRKYLLYRKLMNSLKALHNQEKLTASAYEGGFSDQSHFIRTFKNSFGALPSIFKK
jgi:AraC-like DNA-binding protein